MSLASITCTWSDTCDSRLDSRSSCACLCSSPILLDSARISSLFISSSPSKWKHPKSCSDFAVGFFCGGISQCTVFADDRFRRIDVHKMPRTPATSSSARMDAGGPPAPVFADTIRRIPRTGTPTSVVCCCSDSAAWLHPVQALLVEAIALTRDEH